MLNSRLASTAAAALATLSLSATALHAQDSDNGSQNGRNWSLSVTAGAAYGPKYLGSDKNEGGALFDLNAEFADGLFFVGLGGIGIAPIRTDTARLSFALAYGGGRDMKDDPNNLRGLGDIDSEALLLLNGEYLLGPVSLGATITGGDTYGVTADLSIGTAVPITSRLTLSGGLTGTWASTDHAQTYFGVTAAQAASSGKPVFTADSGFISGGVGLSLDYAINDRTSVTLGIDYQELQGDAARSSISVEDEQFLVGLSLTRSL